MFRARLTNDLKSIEEDIYVVEDLAQPLLGRNAAANLKLISRVCELTSDDYKAKVMHEYPRLFTGLGKTEEEYTIKLKDGSKPFALSMPRKVPMLLYAETKKEIQRMLESGVISHVVQPTE